MMFNIAICDDDQNEILNLKKVITEYFEKINYLYSLNTFRSGDDLLKSIIEYGLIFLDIQMENLNGIEIAKKIRLNDKHVKIIYITNYTNYQADAFSVRAFGYVNKPYTKNTIFKQLNDVLEYSNREDDQIKFTFYTDQGIKTFCIDNIYFFEAYNHKTKIVCNQEIYITDKSIKDIIDLFKCHGFSMPHKSFVINMKYISKIKGYDIFLLNGMTIPISQKRAVEFKSEFHSYLKNNFNQILRGI